MKIAPFLVTDYTKEYYYKLSKHQITRIAFLKGIS